MPIFSSAGAELSEFLNTGVRKDVSYHPTTANSCNSTDPAQVAPMGQFPRLDNHDEATCEFGRRWIDFDAVN